MAKTFRRPKQLVAALHGITHRTVFLSVCLCFLQSRAQDNIRFQNLDINSGLSQSSALAITQDETGFIWIGTQDGLNRFDGFSFKVYRNESDNANTISSNFVQALATGEHGTLWVGTREGLNRYDAKTDRF
jgi:ligand-binding sensor domain-containing protein